MQSFSKFGQTIRFDDSGFSETPYVYSPLQSGRVYEQAFLERIRSLQLVGEYIDIGAHLGTHTIWFGAMCPSTHVHAIEPIDRFAKVIERNVAANDLQSKITIHKIGLSDRPGEATNYLSSEHQVGFTEAPTGINVEFPIQRLDDLISGPVSLIKLDVEGMEPEVLLGSSRLLSRYQPIVYAEAQTSEAVAKITEVLSPHGYVATGMVFNATPTYEFAVLRGINRLTVPLWNRLRSFASIRNIRRVLRRLVPTSGR